MQCGFAMLCAGSIRQKNVKHILLKNLLDACGGAIGYFIIGYELAFGTGAAFVGTLHLLEHCGISPMAVF